jgi:hypothetical protein
MLQRSPRFLPFGRWLLVMGLLCPSGCLSFLHPVRAPRCDGEQVCQALPRGCRDHVYVFVVNGIDPLDLANLEGVRDYVQGLGFRKTYYGYFYHAPGFAREIRRIHQEDPEARFVLVGFSIGANAVRGIAKTCKQDGICTDLVVFVDGNTLRDVPGQEEVAKRVCNVRAGGSVWWKTAELTTAHNFTEPEAPHFGSPTDPGTLGLLAQGLAEVATTVPIIGPATETPALEEAPTPRPLTSQTVTERDEWDFLKPVSVLRPRLDHRETTPQPSTAVAGEQVVTSTPR